MSRYRQNSKFNTSSNFLGSLESINRKSFSAVSDVPPPEVTSVVSQAIIASSVGLTWCGNEGSSCSLPNDSVVYFYGLGNTNPLSNSANSKSPAGQFLCSNSNFDHDPAFFIPKQCAYKVSAPSVLTHCADEGSTCTLPGGGPVTYFPIGNMTPLPSNSITKNEPAGSFLCGNTIFGNDPAPGTPKQCAYSLTLPVPIGTAVSDAKAVGLTWCGNENWGGVSDTCNIPSDSIVYMYAVGNKNPLTNSSKLNVSTGNFSCKSGLFQSDPAPGVAKQFAYISVADVAVAAAAAATAAAATAAATAAANLANTQAAADAAAATAAATAAAAAAAAATNLANTQSAAAAAAAATAAATAATNLANTQAAAAAAATAAANLANTQAATAAAAEAEIKAKEVAAVAAAAATAATDLANKTSAATAASAAAAAATNLANIQAAAAAATAAATAAAADLQIKQAAAAADLQNKQAASAAEAAARDLEVKHAAAAAAAATAAEAAVDLQNKQAVASAAANKKNEDSKKNMYIIIGICILFCVCAGVFLYISMSR